MYDSGHLFITLEREGLVCLDGATGERLWANDQVRGVVFASHNNALLVRDGQTVYRIRADSGDIIESVEFPGITEIATETFTDGSVFTMGAKGLVQKFVPAF